MSVVGWELGDFCEVGSASETDTDYRVRPIFSPGSVPAAASA